MERLRVMQGIRKGGDRVWIAALVLACVCALVPLRPGMPSEGLDPSWTVGMNQAVAQGLVFGRDIVFTFGPYASVYTHVFHPATDAMMLGASLVLALALSVALALLLRSAGWIARIGVLVLLSGLMYSRDALFAFMVLAAGVVCWRLLPARDGEAPIRGGLALLVLATVFVPVGLLPLVKGSLLALGAVVTVLAAILCLLERLWLRAAIVVLVPVAAAMSSWALAGQPLAALPGYLQSMMPIVSGYTEAMSAQGRATEAAAYLLAAAALLWAQASQLPRGRGRPLVLLMLAAALFLAFKGGFVRHDAHAGMAGIFLLLALLLVAGGPRRVPVYLAAALSLLAWGIVDQRHFHTTLARVGQQAEATYVAAWHGLRGRLQSPDALDAEYAATMQRLARGSAFGKLPGTSDIYSYQQVEVIAPGNAWNPRPVLQSYSAYTPVLADRNREHLAGAGAPDNVIFRIEPIDARMPALEDGASWPQLLAGYEPVQFGGDALLLRKRSAPRSLGTCGGGSTQHALDETVALPPMDADCAGFVQLEIRPTLLGAIAAFLYKPSPLQVRLQLADGSRREYRLVAGMARAGLLLSPLVENVYDFGLLYAGLDELAAKKVRVLTVSSAKRKWMWNASYTLAFHGRRVPGEGKVLRLYDGMHELRPAGELAIGNAPGCMASLDALNGGPVQPSGFSAMRTLQVRGWLGTADGQSPEKVFVVLTDTAGSRLLAEATRTRRPDVAAYFGKPSLENSGFVAAASVASLRGSYRVSLGYEENGAIRLCPGQEVAGTIGGAP